MRNYDFTPLYRSTVGFDRLASMLDVALTADTGTNTYPPYNIEKAGENKYRITSVSYTHLTLPTICSV